MATPTVTITETFSGSPTATPSATRSASASSAAGSILNSLNSANSYTPGSVGINIPQVLVAGVEASLMGSNMKNAAIIAGSVGLSNLLPSYPQSMYWGSASCKFLVEPAIAGILYSLSGKLISSGEKEKSMLKKFVKGFLIGSSSAAVGGALYGATMANSRVPSMYSATGAGLRGPINKPANYPQFIVS